MGALPLPPPHEDDDGRRRRLGGPERLSARDARAADSGSDPIDPARLVVPDDLRGLEDEVRAVQAELGIDPRCWEPGWTGRRARLAARLGRGRRAGAGDLRVSLAGRPLLVGPIIAGILLLVACLVALFPPVMSSPMRRPPAPPRLATPAEAPGTVGGLLPDVALDSPSGAVAARSLRPAVVLLVPDGCACRALIAQARAQAMEFPGLDAALIASGRDPATLQLLVDASSGSTRTSMLIDRDATLARTYRAATVAPPGPSAPTVLLVAGDGVLREPPLVFADGTRLEGSLLPLMPQVT